MNSHRTYSIEFASSLVDLSDDDIYFGIKFGFLDSPTCQKRDLDEKYEFTSILKWMFISIKWSIDNIDNYQDLFNEIDYIVADFEYPEWAIEILSFLPASYGEASVEGHLDRIKSFSEKLKKEIELRN